MTYIKGKGAQCNLTNRFSENYLETDGADGVDEAYHNGQIKTQIFIDSPSSIVSFNKSPDLSFEASINPYQGCEHGCVYCYARNSHEYWGFSAGLDFESRIIIKPNAVELLEKTFLKRSWKPQVVMLSGNTDCYQPLERQYQLTRGLLQIFQKYQNPVGIITKNALITRDVDLLSDLAREQLVRVFFSINTLDESLRRVLEPRTASAQKKYAAMEQLAAAGVQVGIMVAPVIPGLNHHEIPEILRLAKAHGASFASYSTVRLNGQTGPLFEHWLTKAYPDRKSKVWNQVRSLHSGHVNESDFYKRQRGEGKLAAVIKQLFEVHQKRYFGSVALEPLALDKFRRNGNYQLFA